MENKRFNLELIISLTIVMVTVIGSTIPLYILSSNQIDALRKDSREQIDALRADSREQLLAIQEEMKDFHGKICAIEERNRK